MPANRSWSAFFGSVKVGRYYFGQLAWQDRMIQLEKAIESSGRLHADSTTAAGSSFQSYAESLGDHLDASMFMLADVATQGFAELSGLLAEQLYFQAQIHDELCRQTFLAQRTARALESPRETQLREIFRTAVMLSGDSLHEEALKELDKCLAIYEYDFMVHYQRGKIFLYGSASANPQKAHQSFLLAQKYGKGAHARIANGERVWAALLLDSAKCDYALANDARLAGQDDVCTAHLKSALETCSSLECPSGEAALFRAQILATLGRKDNALAELRSAIEEDRSYYYVALDMPEFLTLKGAIAELRRQLLSSGKGAQLRQLINEHNDLCARLSRDFPLFRSEAMNNVAIQREWEQFSGKPGETLDRMRKLLSQLKAEIRKQFEQEIYKLSSEIKTLEGTASLKRQAADIPPPSDSEISRTVSGFRPFRIITWLVLLAVAPRAFNLPPPSPEFVQPIRIATMLAGTVALLISYPSVWLFSMVGYRVRKKEEQRSAERAMAEIIEQARPMRENLESLKRRMGGYGSKLIHLLGGMGSMN